MYVGHWPRHRCALAHEATMYSGVLHVDVFVPPYPFRTRPPVSVLRSTLWISHDTWYSYKSWPAGQSGLVFLGIFLATQSPCELVMPVGIQRTADVTGIKSYCTVCHWNQVYDMGNTRKSRLVSCHAGRYIFSYRLHRNPWWHRDVISRVIIG